MKSLEIRLLRGRMFYAYVDIHNPEIDRPEVKAFTEKLKKLGVDCRFSSLSRPIS